MGLIKTTFLSGISTAIKVLSGLILLKVIAIYTGPDGMGKIGQFTAIINILFVIAGGGINLGVIKYTAEHAPDQKQLNEFISSASYYIFIFCILTTLFGIIFKTEISLWLFGDTKYSTLIFWTSITQNFVALSLFVSAVVNGLKQIPRLLTITILSSLLSLIMVSAFAYSYGLYGALYGLIFSQFLAAIMALGLVCKQPWFAFIFKLNRDKENFRKLLHYSFMTIVSTLTVPMAQILVRNDMRDLFSWDEVGLWQGVIRLSDAYIVFITTALTAYYLPRLSEIKNKAELKNEILSVHKLIVPMVLAITVLLYVFRDQIIILVYSGQFMPMRDLFLYQFAGDFFRICSWIFTYLLLAKAQTKLYVGTEIVLSLLFVLICHFSMQIYGVVGVTYGFFATYFIYWIIMLFIAAYYFRSFKNA